MSSPNILLTRIDNRLVVHGQVGVTWTSTIGANLLVVVMMLSLTMIFNRN